MLAADLVGYSRLMGRDEVGTLARLTRLRREVIDPAIAACRGRIVKTTGDGLLSAFTSVVDATRCAIRIQRGVAERNAGVPEAELMRFRIGVNIGDAIVSGDDIFGDCVNIAARLETLAPPGGICLSKAAHDQVRGKIKAAFVDAGAHEVKNITIEVETFELDAAAIEAVPASELTADAAPARSRRIAAAMLALCVALVLAGGAAYVVLNRRLSDTLEARLTALLDHSLQQLPAKARERSIADYLAGPHARAFAVAPVAQSRSWSGGWPSREIAIEKVLERCQINFNEPCAVIAVDDEMVASGPDGTFPTADMPRTHYDGSFDPDRIPAMRATISKRSDVAGYAAATGPKAAAMHARGVFHIVTGAKTQRGAEFQALKACNDDPFGRRAGAVLAPCYLYAVGNSVVLPQRLSAPLTQR